MIATETKLWDGLKAAVHDTPKSNFTRIETSTVDGVADVEYVAQPWHGWIELKTARMPRAGKPFSLPAPFTLLQCGWLLQHHVPRYNLYSWVLLGIVGERTWDSFVLVPAPLTTHLLHSRRNKAAEWLLERKGVHHCAAMRDVAAIVKGPPRWLK